MGVGGTGVLGFGAIWNFGLGFVNFFSNTGQDIILRIFGKKPKMVLYNGRDRSFGEMKESNEEFGKAILKGNLKRMQKKSTTRGSARDEHNHHIRNESKGTNHGRGNKNNKLYGL